MFKQILVPTDFSKKNTQAIDIAVRLALEDNATVHILHVIEAIADTTFEDFKDFYTKPFVAIGDLNGDGKIEGAAELRAWLKGFLEGDEVEEFQAHYDFLSKHDELQGNDDQRLLAAIHLLSSGHDFNGDVARRFDNVGYRYGFHPDSLQMIYFLANQLGMPLGDDNFSEDTLQQLLNQAKVVGPAGYEQTGASRVSAGGQAGQNGQGKPAIGMVSDKLTVDTMRNPAEFFRMLKGKMKTDIKQYVIQNTKNKRADEGNPDALYKNFGTRRVKKV